MGAVKNYMMDTLYQLEEKNNYKTNMLIDIWNWTMDNNSIDWTKLLEAIKEKDFSFIMKPLAKENGYTEEFLIDIWNDCMKDPDNITTFDDFVQITRERDW